MELFNDYNTPHFELIKAVIYRALMDAHGRNGDDKKDAIWWFESPQSSFPLFCAVLGWKVDYVRPKFMHYIYNCNKLGKTIKNGSGKPYKKLMDTTIVFDMPYRGSSTGFIKDLKIINKE